MKIIDELLLRGLIQDISDEGLLRSLKAGDTFYVGFDPTAPSLQVGNLVPLVTAIHLAKAGLKPLILFGGATGSIGDPSGKSEERKLLSREELDKNVRHQTAQAKALFARVGVEAEFINNLDWTQDLTLLDFLRDVGKHFTVNYMIAKETVKKRLGGEGISFTEFSYMLLQGFDFHHLYKTRNCRMQIGGSDQWGNITAGLELIRKKENGEREEQGPLAFSIPLLTDSHGKKFGKSESGAVWIDPELFSPYKFHQYWLNCADEDVVKCLKMLTFLPQDVIESAEKEIKNHPEKRDAQRLLADEMCTLVHGSEATKLAKASAEVLFGGSCENLDDSELESIFRDVPSYSVARENLHSMSFVELLTESGAVKSKGEGKKLVGNGGAYLNNERVDNPQFKIQASPVAERGIFIVRTGKKNYRLIRVMG